MADTEWGEWDAAPGESPDDCLRSLNADKITQLSNIVTPGAITDGAITDGDITDGAIADGDITKDALTEGATENDANNIQFGLVTANGTPKVFVNGKGL